MLQLNQCDMCSNCTESDSLDDIDNKLTRLHVVITRLLTMVTNSRWKIVHTVSIQPGAPIDATRNRRTKI